MTEGGNEGWNQWSQYVLHELERAHDVNERQDHTIQKLREELARWKGGILVLWSMIGIAVALLAIFK